MHLVTLRKNAFLSYPINIVCESDWPSTWSSWCTEILAKTSPKEKSPVAAISPERSHVPLWIWGWWMWISREWRWIVWLFVWGMCLDTRKVQHWVLLSHSLCADAKSWNINNPRVTFCFFWCDFYFAYTIVQNQFIRYLNNKTIAQEIESRLHYCEWGFLEPALSPAFSLRMHRVSFFVNLSASLILIFQIS